MTTSSVVLTQTDLIAASSRVLERGGYQPIRDGFPDWDTPSSRLFENQYNVVGIVVFATFSELLSSWADRQGSLVDVISKQVGLTEGKAWDGYLVLLAIGVAPSGDAATEIIRSDTTRLRKFLATGEDLKSASDVERLLRPLIPLRALPESLRNGTALDVLPALLAAQGIAGSTTEVLVKAYVEQRPLVDALHRHRVSR